MTDKELLDQIASYVVDYPRFNETPHEVAELIHDASKRHYFDTVIPALDRLQDRLEQGCRIEYQDDLWWLFESSGEGVVSGKTIRALIVSLIFTDC